MAVLCVGLRALSPTVPPLSIASDMFLRSQRMAGLSQLLSHPPGTPLTFNPDAWLELAQQTPLGIAGGPVDLDGLQAMMFYYEAYRAIGDWRAAPVGLVRTAGEVYLGIV